MRTVAALISLVGTPHVALAVNPTVEAADEVAITSDGGNIIVSYMAEDGARVAPNLTVYVVNRKGVVTKTIAVIDADKGAVSGGDAARAKLLAATKPVQMPLLEPIDPDPDVDTRRVYAGLTVDLSESGTLTVRPKGHAAIERSNPEWRTKPDARKVAQLKHNADEGRVGCFNPAGIGPVWLDAQRRAAVVLIHYHGNDACWEPSSDFAVVTW
jgi:hypothetical protein